MRRHVPFKASIRRPVQTFIFVLLVGLASFGFVSRAVEYTILNREMDRIEQFYRTTGTLVPIDPLTHNNVYEAASIVRSSPYVQFEDRRTITQGVMHGILNAMEGQATFGQSFIRGWHRYEYKDLYVDYTVGIIHVVRVHSGSVVINPPWGDGVTRHVTRNLVLRFHDVLYGHSSSFHETRQYIAIYEIDEDGNSPIDHLQEGGFYLAKAIPQQAGHHGTGVEFFPLFDDVYFVDARDRDAMRAAMRTMADELAILEANTQMLMITGTKDMTTLPLVKAGAYQRFQGRFIGYEDYRNANHVMVIPQRMDSTRRYARVGQTVTLTLRDMRTFLDGSPVPEGWEDREGYWRNLPAGYWVSIPSSYAGDWRNYPIIEIEVEVVGTYVIDNNAWLPRWAHISDSFQNMEVFVPASIIPEGFGIVGMHMVSGQYSFVLTSPLADVPFMEAHGYALAQLGFTVQFLGEDPTNFMLSVLPIRNSIRINLALFTAVLALVLVLTVFLYLRQRYKEFAILRALGISSGNATWQVAVPVLVFWLPVVIGASIGAWFFAFRQVAENLRLIVAFDTLTDYAAPFVVRNILQQMRYEAEQAIVREIPQLSMVYLVRLCAGIAVAWIGTVLAGTVLFARKSMISLLQSANGGGAPVRAMKETAPPADIKLSDIGEVLVIMPARRVGGAVKSVWRHHWRHVYRSPVKSLLVVCMALLFIAALGWLDRTIGFTQQEIDRLYATTTITGELINRRAIGESVSWQGQHVPLSSVEKLMASGYVEDVYMTSLAFANLFPAFPIDTEAENIMEAPVASMLWERAMGVTCLETFMYKAAQPAAFGMSATGDFTIEFVSGFDPADFSRGWREKEWGSGQEVPVEEPIPIIVHESFLSRWGLLDFENMENIHIVLDEYNNWVSHDVIALGDAVYLFLNQWPQTAGLTDGSMLSAVIVGVYSGGHPSIAYNHGQGLILLSDTRFNRFFSVEFTMYQDKILYMFDFADDMNEQLNYRIHYTQQAFATHGMTEDVHHEVVLNDAEFRTVVIPLEENLNLLRLLYPIAKVMSFVLALGLTLLLMLQNAKNVAILRVLGVPRYRTRLNLGAEQLAVCITGVAIGLVAVLFMGIGMATAGLLVGIYMAGAAIGTIVGVLVISYRTPLELLQVRE